MTDQQFPPPPRPGASPPPPPPGSPPTAVPAAVPQPPPAAPVTASQDTRTQDIANDTSGVAGAAVSAPIETGRPRLAMALAVTFGATAATMIAWLASKDAIVRADADSPHVVTPIVAFAVAGGLWGALQPGARRAARSTAGVVAGALVGAIGGLLLTPADKHVEAFAEDVVSSESIGRGALWAVIGAVGWAVVVGVASSPMSRARAALGAAIGGATIGATMGVLTGTPLGSQELFATDVWFSAWVGFEDSAVQLAPISLLFSLVPLVVASVFGASTPESAIGIGATEAAAPGPRRPSLAPVALAVVGCLVLGVAGAWLGVTSAMQDQRNSGEAFGDGGIIPGAKQPSTSASPTPASSAPELPEPLPTVSYPSPSTVSTVATPVEPAATEATTPGPVYHREVVATDINVGFPIATDLRLSGTNELSQGVQVRLVVGEARRFGEAPTLVDGPLSCTADPTVAVFPFFLQVIPYAEGVSRVRVAFSQGATGVADVNAYPLGIEFHDFEAVRCESAVNPDFESTTAAVVWSTLANGEAGGEYGYFIVPNYYDANGEPVPAAVASAVVGPILDLNRSYTTWTSSVTGSTSTYFQYGAYSGQALALTP